MRALATRALEAWDLQVQKLEMVSLSENVVFRVGTDGGDFALRIHRPGYHTRAELDSEQMWGRALSEFGVGVPLGVLTRTDEYYVEVPMPDGAGDTRLVGLIPWFDGETLAQRIRGSSDDAQRLADFAQLGAVIAQTHNQASGWEPPAGFVRHSLDADGLMGSSPFWGPFWDPPELSGAQRALVLETRDLLHPRLEALGKDPQTYSMIHADLHSENVMVDGDRVQVIDFDDAGFGFHAYDIAVALFDLPKQAYPAVRDALLHGYRSKRPLDDAVVELLPMFDLIRALAILGWLYERPEQPRKFVEAVIVRACAQAEALKLGEST